MDAIILGITQLLQLVVTMTIQSCKIGNWQIRLELWQLLQLLFHENYVYSRAPR